MLSSPHRHPFGGTIAHGMLLLAYIGEMMAGQFGTAWFREVPLKCASASLPDQATMSQPVDESSAWKMTMLVENAPCAA